MHLLRITMHLEITALIILGTF